MSLLPSLRQKKRYIVFNVNDEKGSLQFTIKEVKKEVEDAIVLFIGQLGMSKAAPMFLKEKFRNNHFILKVNHKWVDECKAALSLIKKIKNKPVIVKSIITSGTLKKAGAYIK